MTQAAKLAALGSAGVATGFKNRIINGAMMIDQRNAGASVTATNANLYTLDRWQAVAINSSKYTVQQNAGSVTPPAGLPNYLGVTSSAATSVGASDYYFLAQYVEGFNSADLAWGTASAATVTLSFKVYSSLTGTFGGSLRNNASDRSYPFSYTVSSANTWTSISVTVPGDTSGTWVGATNGIGIRVCFGLGIGSTYSGTAGAWAAGNYIAPTSAVSVVGTNGATFYITGVQLEVGTTATTFDFRSYGTELALCQRYCNVYATSSNSDMFCIGYNNSTSVSAGILQLPVEMRSAPSVTFNQSASSYGVYAVPYNTVSCSAVAILNQATTKTVGIQFTSSGLTAGYGTLFKNAGSGAANITISAEL